MSHGLIDEATKWRRRGLAEPWLADSFLADLSPSALCRLERDASLLRAGQIDGGTERASQQLAGHTGAPVAIVLDGAVKVFHTRWDGPDALINVAGPGDVLNVEEFLTGVVMITRYVSSGNAVLLVIHRDKFHGFLDSDEKAQRVLTLTLARRVQTLTIQRGHAGRKVEQRLWAFLVHLLDVTADGSTMDAFCCRSALRKPTWQLLSVLQLTPWRPLCARCAWSGR